MFYLSHSFKFYQLIVANILVRKLSHQNIRLTVYLLYLVYIVLNLRITSIDNFDRSKIIYRLFLACNKILVEVAEYISKRVLEHGKSTVT